MIPSMSTTDTRTDFTDTGLPSTKDVLTFRGIQREAARLELIGDRWASAELDVENMAQTIVSIMVAATAKGVDLESLVLAELAQRENTAVSRG